MIGVFGWQGSSNQYTSISHCVGTILKEEGASAFLKVQSSLLLIIAFCLFSEYIYIYREREVGKFKCEQLFGCEREDNRERATWRRLVNKCGFDRGPPL